MGRKAVWKPNGICFAFLMLTFGGNKRERPKSIESGRFGHGNRLRFSGHSFGFEPFGRREGAVHFGERLVGRFHARRRLHRLG